MSTHAPFVIHGALGSPYSMKMRAILRYKRVVHIWSQLGEKTAHVRGKVKAPVIPVIEYPDGTFRNDSTPVAAHIDEMIPSRSIYPDDPAARFVALLIEDFADEWATKWMFHYRWAYALDEEMLGRWLASDQLGAAGRDTVEAMGKAFAQRQVGRMALVGCTPDTRPLIEETYVRTLTILDRHVTDIAPYLFGTRPSIADFALYGQLSQLINDPVSAQVARAHAPFAYRWTQQVDDTSGVEGGWQADLSNPDEAVRGLLGEVGTFYLPFLLANAKAVAGGEESFAVELDGRPWQQGAFKYQAKCLQVLRDALASLADADRARLKPLLGDTGCWDALQS